MESRLCTLVTVLLVCFHSSVADDETYSLLLARIEKLENEVQDYRGHTAEQSTDIDYLKSVVENQNKRLREQDTTIQMLLERMQEPLYETPEQEDELPEQTHQKETNINKGRLSVRGKDGSRSSRLVLGREGPVAFHAIISGNTALSHLGKNQNVVFDNVKLNLGSGYHSQHGIFIAPAPGLYIFSVSALSYTSDQDHLDVLLMKNGENLGGAYGHRNVGDSQPWDQGSVTIVTQLNTSDEVWVSHVYGTVWGNYYSSFMGCLVVPLS